MDMKKISDDISVSPQIAPDDVAAIAAQGFRAVICNRPDGEGEGQPAFAEIAAAARAAGLEAHYIPVVPGKMGEEDVAAFGDALRAAPGPVLAYCKSGARSTALFSRLRERG